MPNKKKKSEAFEKQNLVILILLIIFFLITIAVYILFNVHAKDVQTDKSSVSASENTNPALVTVTRVIDGDTFEISSGEIVRLICVDTPEQNKQGYEESKEFLSNLILNKKIRLEKDVSDKDSYGRLLRYVYVIESKSSCKLDQNKENEISDQACVGSSESQIEIFVNKEIVKNNYAKPFPYAPDTKRCDEISG
ncbi:Staphylococcal nuclease homologue [uncultured archaeon]|nr:Staphylococcal nuclease homologue [uncultured archaeon]